MSEEQKTETKPEPALFEVLLQVIGDIANKQNLTLPDVLGHLELCKKSAIDQVIAHQQQKMAAASESSEGDDKQEPEVVTPEVVEDKA